MASVALSRIDLPEGVAKLAETRGIRTADALFRYGALELMERLHIPYFVAQQTLDKAAEAIAPTVVAAHTLLGQHEASDAPSAVPLDPTTYIRAVRGVTEFAGAAGLGKTQTCLSLAAVAAVRRTAAHVNANAAPSFDSVIYIDTESTFSASRFAEIAQARYPRVFGDVATVRALTQAVHVFSARTTKDLLSVLKTIEPTIIESRARLLILDSIAAPVRVEFTHRNDFPKRQQMLSVVAARLKVLSEVYDMPVVVTNQVTSTASGTVSAALGVSWEHAVNQRVEVREVVEPVSHALMILHGSMMPDTASKEMRLAKSPCFPECRYVYEIGKAGVVVKGRM